MNMTDSAPITRQVKAAAGKYLTFTLADESYGIEITKLREIIGMAPINSVPQTPAYFKGVINLRGKVIPVVDLRLRFGLPPAPYSVRTCIIIVEIKGGKERISTGIVVDSVSDVAHIKIEDIEDPPAFGAATDTRFILGMAKSSGNVKILLDIDNVLNHDEKVLLSKAA